MSELLKSPSGRGLASPLRGSSSNFLSVKSQGILPSNTSPTAKLEHVTERFSALWSDLEQEKQAKKNLEASRHQLTAEAITRLEKNLESEIKRRIETDKQLQTHFETEIKTLADKTAQQFSDLQQGFKVGLDALTRTVTDLAQLIKDERDQRRGDIEHLASNLVAKVNECVSALDEERAIRMDNHTASMKRVGEDIYRIQEKIETEKATRESELTQLRSEIHEALGNRNLADEKFQALVVEQLGELKSSLQVEREERIAEDDEIVQAVNDYTRALQEGLKVVSASN